MSKQVTVRLPDETVRFIDQLVAENRAPSRAAVIARAVERERRRELAARDLRILTELGTGTCHDHDAADLSTASHTPA